MNVNIYLIGCHLYDEKDKSGNKTGQKKCRIGYFYAEPKYKNNSEAYKGFTEKSAFVPKRVFDDLPVEWFGTTVVAEIKKVPDEKDPLKEKIVINSLTKDDTTVILV